MTAGDTSDLRLLRFLQDWYLANCDGKWEHQYGVSIHTLDNPGWVLKIDTSRTTKPLCDRGSIDIEINDEVTWMTHKIEDGVFIAAGGPQRLGDMIAAFKAEVEK